MSVSPINASVKCAEKRCLPKFTRLEVIKVAIETTVLVTLIGMVVSNTILIRNNGPAKVSVLDKQVFELASAYETLLDELSEVKEQMNRASGNYTDYKLDIEESFSLVQDNFDSIEKDLRGLEDGLNQVKTEQGRQQDFTANELENAKLQINHGARRTGVLENQVDELRTEYDISQVEMRKMQEKLKFTFIDYTDFKITTNESLTSVQIQLEEIDNDLLETKVNLNETQLELELTNIQVNTSALQIIDLDERLTDNQIKFGEIQIEFERQRDFTIREFELVKLELNTVTFNSTCEEIWSYGVRDNGFYMIQPTLDAAPFEVYCEFEANSATTVLFYSQTQANWTATPDEHDGCEEKGCFTDVITYNATKYQVEALLYLSEKCQQEITHFCSTNPLTNFAFWNDRHGREVAYWNGDKDVTATGCACSEDNSCIKLHEFNFDRECNCDDNRADLFDDGVLTSMSQLPVMQLNYGGSSLPYSYINYELG